MQQSSKLTLGAGITHWQSPYFFGYFPCNSSFPALLGDMLCSGLATQNFSWIGSPAATELETVSGRTDLNKQELPCNMLPDSGCHLPCMHAGRCGAGFRTLPWVLLPLNTPCWP